LGGSLKRNVASSLAVSSPYEKNFLLGIFPEALVEYICGFSTVFLFLAIQIRSQNDFQNSDPFQVLDDFRRDLLFPKLHSLKVVVFWVSVMEFFLVAFELI
jgi:hypothetical protein